MVVGLDRRSRFRFATAQSLLGEALFRQHGLRTDRYETNLVLIGGAAFTQLDSLIPVRVRFDADGGAETWIRTFGAQSFSSRQFAGQGRSKRLLCERFGPLTFAMALVAEQGKLSLVLRRWCILGLPLPMWLCPRSTSHETVRDGRFRFHVEISHPLTGLIVRYRGWLEPVDRQCSGETVSALAG